MDLSFTLGQDEVEMMFGKATEDAVTGGTGRNSRFRDMQTNLLRHVTWSCMYELQPSMAESNEDVAANYADMCSKSSFKSGNLFPRKAVIGPGHVAQHLLGPLAYPHCSGIFSSLDSEQHIVHHINAIRDGQSECVGL